MTDFKRHDHVRIVDGALAGETGTVMDGPLDGGSYSIHAIRILLDSHDHGGALYLSPDSLELIEAADLPKVGDWVTTLADLEALPLGTTLIVDGIGAYQRIIDGDWYVAGSDIGTDSAELIRSKSLLIVWLPEVADA